MPLDTPEEVYTVACGIGTAVAGSHGLTDSQCALLTAITHALTDVTIDYGSVEPLGADELALALADRDDSYRRRILHHMVLGELILVPLPAEVAARVQTYGRALGIDDDFVRLAREYAHGALDVALSDLQRSGFTDRWNIERQKPLYTDSIFEDPFDKSASDSKLAERWAAFAELPIGTLGRSTWAMYEMRGWDPPGTERGQISAFLAQHDFVHVLADYGTTMEGEMEVFSFIGRADPDPKGFAWLAAMVGLFETGYVSHLAVFDADVQEHTLQSAGMTTRLADGIRRGKAVQERFGTDLFSVDYHALSARPIEEVREYLRIPPKSETALEAGSPSVFDPAGASA